MDHNIDDAVFVNKQNSFGEFWKFVTSSSYKRTLGIIAILIIGFAIPLTALIAQKRTETKQHAANGICDNPYTISGIVRDQNGQGVSGAAVCLDPAGNGDCSGSPSKGITSNDGTYNLIVIPGAGTTGHNVYVSNFNNPNIISVPNAVLKTEPTSGLCPDITDVNFTVTTATSGCTGNYTISGIVRSQAGPLSGAVVCTDPTGNGQCPNQGSPNAYSITNSSGEYSINTEPGAGETGHNVYVSKYKLSSTTPNLPIISVPDAKHVSETASGICQNVQYIDFNDVVTEVAKCNTYTVSGNVKTPNGVPIINAYVCLDPNGLGTECLAPNMHDMTDNNGYYSITVPEGPNTNTVGHTLYALKKSVTLGDGNNSSATITDGNTQHNNVTSNEQCSNVTKNLVAAVTTSGSGTSPSPTATTAPPPPGGATATNTPTPTTAAAAPPPGGTTVSFSLVLSGIVSQAEKAAHPKWNTDPKPPTKDMTVYLYAPNVNPNLPSSTPTLVIPGTNALTYDNNGKFVAQTFNLGQNFVPGNYQVLVKSPRYLRASTKSIIAITQGANTTPLQATLPVGDINNDNTINIEDYNEYKKCFNSTSDECVKKTDLNSDGKTDKSTDFSDLILFLENLASQKGE